MKQFLHFHRRLVILALAITLLSTTTVAWLDYTFGTSTVQARTVVSASNQQSTGKMWFWYANQWTLPQQ